jgi:hypothetical protein
MDVEILFRDIVVSSNSDSDCGTCEEAILVSTYVILSVNWTYPKTSSLGTMVLVIPAMTLKEARFRNIHYG